MINIGILGMGTIGTGVVEVINENAERIYQRTGERLKIKRILVRDLKKKRAVNINHLLTNDPEEILRDDEIDIVVELMGGLQPACNYIKRAMENGKHVVTANKEVISKCGRDLFEVAKQKGVNLLFEASVGGGIPIIRPLKQCLAANEINEIIGIINGTTNYILTEMTENKMDFYEVLKKAQELGYAESDPSADIEGMDAARKLAILSSIAFNTRIIPEDIYTEGISKIKPVDILYADELGFKIKLLALARKHEQGIEARVSPVLLPKRHPLSSVMGVFNAIMVKGFPVGEVMFYGMGAGKEATSSAVVADIVDAVRNRSNKNITLCTCFADEKVIPAEQTESRFFIRMLVDDKPGVLAKIAGAVGDNNISIRSVIQKNRYNGTAEIVLITHRALEKNISSAVAEIIRFEEIKDICNIIRVEGDD